MKILVIGNGGREHALAWKLAQSPLVEQIYVAPGNGGTELLDKCVNIPIGFEKRNFKELADFAVKNGVKLVVPGPEQPLVEGITEVFQNANIPVFGPSQLAARMEGSKAFSKAFMRRHNIPTAAYEVFDSYELASSYIERVNHKVVIKASGLAAGKGVIIPDSKEEALKALKSVMEEHQFGEAGDEVVIEEFLEGDEISILALTDGYTCVDLPPAQDHKRIYDGDKGPNTGGMGSYAPAPIATPEIVAKIKHEILEPTLRGMRKEKFPMVGCLFVGVMLTCKGPYVLEYNVRFGDPETQSILGLIKSDLAEVMLAAANHCLDAVDMNIERGYGATVVMAAGGYPGPYAKGDEIIIETLPRGTQVFHAGTKYTSSKKILTNGGRVLAVSAWANTLREAVDLAYSGISNIQFSNKFYRTDIACLAFAVTRREEGHAVSPQITYESAGVSVDSGNEFVQQIKEEVQSTKRTGADATIGGFGGLFDLKACNFNDPILVAATDGVGTKLKIAQAINKHDTVGIDLVAMSVNDLIVQGAEPLFFLDYFASGRLVQQTAVSFVSGVARGCKAAGCALIGGETAEMPGMYAEGDYDVNGTCVGAVERDRILPCLSDMAEGDIVIGLSSSGIHSNGFSLVRRILEVNNLGYNDPAPWDTAISVGESLLEPTRIYVKPILRLLEQPNRGGVVALAHITGGGLVENIPRILPQQLNVELDAHKWPLPPIFAYLKKAGNVPTDDIVKTLNMGVGMVLIVKTNFAERAVDSLSLSEKVHVIGKVTKGEGLCKIVNTDAWD